MYIFSSKSLNSSGKPAFEIWGRIMEQTLIHKFGNSYQNN